MSLYMLLLKPADELYGCHPIVFCFVYVYYLSFIFVFEARSVKQYLSRLSEVVFNYYI